MTDYRNEIELWVRKNVNPEDKFEHQPRVYLLAQSIGEELSYDDDVVHAAAWLHDIGVFIGHRPSSLELLETWDSVAYAVENVPRILSDMQFPPEKIPLVIEVIRTHGADMAPQTIEGHLLRDADILELLGAAGLVRTLAKIGRDTRYRTHHDAVRALQWYSDNLPRKLYFDKSKEMAAAKISFLKLFLEASVKEFL